MDPIKSYASVQKWMANVNRYYHLDEAEWEGRLKALDEFCQHLGKDPDAMIHEALEERQEKIDFMRRLKRFAQEAYRSPRAAHDWENVVRSFFIHNGARVVVRPYADTTPH